VCGGRSIPTLRGGLLTLILVEPITSRILDTNMNNIIEYYIL
jgi:hypothetical protein